MRLLTTPGRGLSYQIYGDSQGKNMVVAVSGATREYGFSLACDTEIRPRRRIALWPPACRQPGLRGLCSSAMPTALGIVVAAWLLYSFVLKGLKKRTPLAACGANAETIGRPWLHIAPALLSAGGFRRRIGLRKRPNTGISSTTNSLLLRRRVFSEGGSALPSTHGNHNKLSHPPFPCDCRLYLDAAATASIALGTVSCGLTS